VERRIPSQLNKAMLSVEAEVFALKIEPEAFWLPLLFSSSFWSQQQWKGIGHRNCEEGMA
jgi:hypothetical protein